MTGVLTPGRGSLSPSRRTPLLVAGTMLLVLVVLAILTRDRAPFSGSLDPRNPERDGAQAVARVLQQQGVDVRVVRGQTAFLDAAIDASTSVVVTNPQQLGRTTLVRLRDHSARAGSLVVVGQTGTVADLFDLGTGSVSSGRRAASCEEKLVRGLVLRTYASGSLEGRGCFGSGDSAVLLRQGRLWLMTSPGSLSNEHVLDADNAALVVRLLGQQPHLVWYVADSADTAPSDGTALSRLLPAWLDPGLDLLLAALLALILLCGRRLGPLVTEPLPVVVRAAESTQSRGRIYRRTGDREHAAAILVDASRRRLTEAVQLPRGTASETLAVAVAARTGRDPQAVLRLLGRRAVTKDSQLVELGQQLNQLEDEVRRS